MTEKEGRVHPGLFFAHELLYKAPSQLQWPSLIEGNRLPQ